MKAGWGKALLSALPVVQLFIPPLSSPLHISGGGRGKGRGLTLNFPSADWSFCLLPGDAGWQLWGSRGTGHSVARSCGRCGPTSLTGGQESCRLTDVLTSFPITPPLSLGTLAMRYPLSLSSTTESWCGQQQGQGTLDNAWSTNQASPSNPQPCLPYLQPSNHSLPWHMMSSAVERLELI